MHTDASPLPALEGRPYMLQSSVANSVDLPFGSVKGIRDGK